MTGQATKREIILRSYLWGIAGSVSLLVLYFLILTISNSLTHAADELRTLGVWIALLALGFGIQTGLFTDVRGFLRAGASARATASAAASGGLSGAAMAACCLHHMTEILPILGVSAASLFLAEHQSTFLAVGVASNLLGITVMLRLIQRQELDVSGRGVLGRLLRFNMNRALIVNSLLGLALVTTTYLSTNL